MKKWKCDLILGLCVMAVSIVCIIYAFTITDPRSTYFLARADTYLGLVFALLILLSVLLIIRAVKSKGTQSGEEIQKTVWDKLTIFTVAALFIYMILINYLGFIIDSIWMMWLMSFLYTLKAKNLVFCRKNAKDLLKKVIATGIFSLVTTGATYYIFVVLLGTKLPKFSLF